MPRGNVELTAFTLVRSVGHSTARTRSLDVQDDTGNVLWAPQHYREISLARMIEFNHFDWIQSGRFGNRFKKITYTFLKTSQEGLRQVRIFNYDTPYTIRWYTRVAYQVDTNHFSGIVSYPSPLGCCWLVLLFYLWLVFRLVLLCLHSLFF